MKHLFLSLAALALVVTGCTPAPATNTNSNANTNTDSTVIVDPVSFSGSLVDGAREIVMTSFYEVVDGAPKPQFSVKNITVKKGEKVRIKVTNTKGGHDFNIDEFNVSEDTPLDEEVVIEFTADQAGEFVYYCNMPNHRAMGHWGTLTVVE